MHLIHRGIVNRYYKENLLSSFRKSFSKGYGVETDIHITKDKKFVCFHDFTLKRIFKKKLSIKNTNYSKLKEISSKKNKTIPLLDDLLSISKKTNKVFIELKPRFSKKNLKLLLKQTSKYLNCVFISFNHVNIYNLLKFKKNIKVGLSFSRKDSIKKILKKSQNSHIDFLVLDKYFINKKKIQKIRKIKYFFTIKNKFEFQRFNKDNLLIFENL